MKKRTFIIYISSIFICTISVIFFIKDTNNHLECSNVTTITILKNGTKIEIPEHICREKYNF
jgi:hypothetical protein